MCAPIHGLGIDSDEEASWKVDDKGMMMNLSFVLNANTNFQGS